MNSTAESQSEASAAHAAHDFLCSDEVAALLRMSRSAFHMMRSRGGGPPVIRISRHVLRWRRADVETWLAKRTEPLGTPQRRRAKDGAA